MGYCHPQKREAADVQVLPCRSRLQKEILHIWWVRRGQQTEWLSLFPHWWKDFWNSAKYFENWPLQFCGIKSNFKNTNIYRTFATSLLSLRVLKKYPLIKSYWLGVPTSQSCLPQRWERGRRKKSKLRIFHTLFLSWSSNTFTLMSVISP